MESRGYNFSAGPAVLPLEVIETVKENLSNYAGCGMGVMELSHRGAPFTEIIQTCEANLRNLLSLSDDYAVLFTTGGASMQFSMVPMNLCAENQIASYVVTGSWAKNALKEAKRFRNVEVAGTSEDKNFCYLPKDLKVSDNAAYLHYTSNNTIFGTQFRTEPEVKNTVLVCDASSDMLHKKIDVNKYGVVYAGAQKNLGPAGVTLVIIRKDLLERCPENLPIMMNYKTYSENASLYNTPPAFPIYVVGEVLKWIGRNGGLDEMEKRNQEKAAILYEAIDGTDFYYCHADRDCRSLMNVTFRIKNNDLEPVFIKEATAQGFFDLKGHRSVGGLRASIYNAFPKQGVLDLVSFMKEFEKKNG
jgi:phosphoserine aminotransferase